MPDRADHRLHSPAAERNRDPILEVLRRVLPPSGLVLEVASGTGQHVVHFARHLDGQRWQPSDSDPRARRSIAAWVAAAALDNVLPALELDTTQARWPIDRADAVICANMIHIAPWEACLGLLAGARRLLAVGAALVLYGPYKRGGRHTAPSNAAFDAGLRAENPGWGVRDLEAVSEAALGFALDEVVAMPANNLTLVFRRVPE